MTAIPKRNIWRSKRLVFRPCETTDEPFLLSLHQHSSEGFQNATTFLPLPQGKTSATRHREWLQSCLLGCIVCLPAPVTADAAPTAATSGNLPLEPIPIGTITLEAPMAAREHHRKTSIGLTISAPYQSQGYGTESIMWVLEWAFRHANLHRVGIAAFAWNEGALRLYERLGFLPEGRMREVVWYDGGYHDMVELGMLDREWWEKYGGRGGDEKSEQLKQSES